MRNPGRAIQTPQATAALFIAACVSLAILPGGTSTDRSTIGRIVSPGTPVARKNASQTWFFDDQGTSWVTVAKPGESADAASRAIAASPGSIVELERVRVENTRGFYDPWRRKDNTWIFATLANGTPLPADRLKSLIATLNQSGAWDPIDPERFELAPGAATLTITTIRWSAVAHNAVAALVWLALPISLGWVPRAHRARRAARRLRAGLCPFCAYDRRSTPAEAPCPECGQTPGASTTPA